MLLTFVDSAEIWFFLERGCKYSGLLQATSIISIILVSGCLLTRKEKAKVKLKIIWRCWDTYFCIALPLLLDLLPLYPCFTAIQCLLVFSFLNFFSFPVMCILLLILMPPIKQQSPCWELIVSCSTLSQFHYRFLLLFLELIPPAYRF